MCLTNDQVCHQYRKLRETYYVCNMAWLMAFPTHFFVDYLFLYKEYNETGVEMFLSYVYWIYIDIVPSFFPIFI